MKEKVLFQIEIRRIVLDDKKNILSEEIFFENEAQNVMVRYGNDDYNEYMLMDTSLGSESYSWEDILVMENSCEEVIKTEHDEEQTLFESAGVPEKE